MGSDFSKSVGQAYRGFGVKHPEWKSSNFRRTDSSMTEANPRPGVPVAAQPTGLVLESSGKMSKISTNTPPSLTIKSVRAGMPGIQDARFIFTPNYSIPVGSDDDIGWEAPNALSRAKLIYDWTGPATATDSLGGCIRLQSNTVLVAMSVSDDPFIFRKVFNGTLYTSGGTVRWDWAAGGIGIDASLTRRMLVSGTGCFLQLPEGRVHFYQIEKNTLVTGQEFFQVCMYWSDDDGLNWTRSSTACLRTQISAIGTYGGGGGTDTGFDIHRMRVGYNNGEVLLMITGVIHQTASYTITNATWQYASSDLGQTFDAIDISLNSIQAPALVTNTASYATGSEHSAANIDISTSVDGSGFIVSYNQCVSTANNVGRPKIKKLGSAFTNWLEVTPIDVNSVQQDYGTITNQYLQGTNTTVASDENGVVVIGLTKQSTGQIWSFVSFDFAESWNDYRCNMRLLSPASPGQALWDSGDVTFYPVNYCSTFQCGRWLILTQFNVGDNEQENEATELDPGKYWELQFGGYSTSTRTFKNSEEEDDQMIMWEREWIGAQRLGDTTGWTPAGTGTETLDTGGWSNLVTAAGQTITRDHVFLAVVSAAGEHITSGECEFATTVGTSRLQIRVGDGVNIIELWLQQTPTNCVVIDVSAGATLYTAGSPSPAGFNTYRFTIDWRLSRASIWVRASDHDNEARPWVPIVAYVAVAKAASVAASRMRVDQPADSTSKWRYICWGDGPYGRALFQGVASFENYSFVYGRTYSPYPIHVYSGDGVRIRATDGPTWVGGISDPTDGDSFTITQRHEYEFENVFPDVLASPRKTWRSDSTSSQQDIVVRVAGTAASSEPWLGRVIFIAAFNVNFQSLQVSYRGPGGGAWTTLGTLNFNTGMTALRFEADGHIIRPNTAGGVTSAGEYFTYNQLEDSHFSANGTAGPVYAVATNAEGAWKDTPLSVRTRLHVNGDAGAVTGTNGEIWAKDGALIIHDAPDIYELRFRIPTQTTAEGYFEIGTLMVGHVAYFGRQYARGRAMTYAPNFNLNTGRGGTRRAQAYGPTRRGVEFGWSNENETDTSKLYDAVPDPDYILPNTGSQNPVASPADTSYKMAGLIDYLRGAGDCAVYFPRIDMVASESTDQTLVNRNLFMLGRLTSDPRIETVLGNEGSKTGELVRHTTVTFEEEV